MLNCMYIAAAQAALLCGGSGGVHTASRRCTSPLSRRKEAVARRGRGRTESLTRGGQATEPRLRQRRVARRRYATGTLFCGSPALLFDEGLHLRLGWRVVHHVDGLRHARARDRPVEEAQVLEDDRVLVLRHAAARVAVELCARVQVKVDIGVPAASAPSRPTTLASSSSSRRSSLRWAQSSAGG